MNLATLFPMPQFNWIEFALYYGWAFVILSLSLIGLITILIILYTFREKKRVKGVDR